MQAAIRYQVTIPNPHAHLVRVEMRFVAPASSPVVALPAWTPGSYLLREFAKHLQELEVEVAGKSGRAEKVSRGSWRIDAGPGDSVVVRYGIYAHELSVRSPHVDGTHAFLTGPGVFLYVEGAEARPHSVVIEAPPGWQTYTTLTQDQGAYRADDYDQLADSFFELGAEAHTCVSFDVEGIAHQVVLWGRGNFKEDALVRDMAKVVAQNGALFGGLPYQRYLFVIHLGERDQGCLEHRDSCVLAWPRNRFVNEYDDFLRLVAHEHFHVWNVKRIRPQALGPFDYQRENYTRALWAMEGVTSYYDLLQIRRAGLITRAKFLEQVTKKLTGLATFPGRQILSLEESSFDAWIRLYRPHENSANTSVSYYLLGSLVALVLDLEIRRATAGEKTYDDVLQALWAHYQRDPKRGLPDEAFKTLIVDVGTSSLKPWVDRYIAGTQEIDWERHLEWVGLELRREKVSKPQLGILKRDEGDRVLVSTILSDGPNAGLNLYPGDELAALNGLQIRTGTWDQVIAALPVGDDIEAALFRRGELVLTQLRTGTASPTLQLAELADASPEQKARLTAWLGD